MMVLNRDKSPLSIQPFLSVISEKEGKPTHTNSFQGYQDPKFDFDGTHRLYIRDILCK